MSPYWSAAPLSCVNKDLRGVEEEILQGREAEASFGFHLDAGSNRFLHQIHLDVVESLGYDHVSDVKNF